MPSPHAYASQAHAAHSHSYSQSQSHQSQAQAQAQAQADAAPAYATTPTTHLPASAYNFHLNGGSSTNLPASAASASYPSSNPIPRSTTPASQFNLVAARKPLYPQQRPQQQQQQQQLQQQPQQQPQSFFDSGVPVSRTVLGSIGGFGSSHPHLNKPSHIANSAPHISSALNYIPSPTPTFAPASLPRTSSLLPPPRITVNETSWKQPPLHDPFNASSWDDSVNDREREENVSPKNIPRRSSKTHSRSSSLGGLSDGFRNLNRWSISTASSRASNATPSTRNRFSRRMSIDSTGLFASQSNQPLSPRRLHQGRPSTAGGPQAEQKSSIPPLATLPPILPLPSIDQEDFGRAALSRAEQSITGGAGLLSDDSLAAHETSYLSTSAQASPESTLLRPAGREDAMMAHSENESPTFVRGHQRSRSQGLKSSTDSASSPRSRDRKQPSQKAMLSKALQKANTAVQLDNAQNFEGARLAYYDACDLLQQVLDRTPGDDDKKKLEAIVSTRPPSKCSHEINPAD